MGKVMRSGAGYVVVSLNKYVQGTTHIAEEKVKIYV